MVSAPVSSWSSLGFSPGQGHCVVFLDKTLSPHNTSLHQGIYMSTGEFIAGGKPCDRVPSNPRRSRNILSCFMLQKLGLVLAGWATWLICRL